MERKRSVRRGWRRPRKPLGEKIKDFLRQFVAFMFSNVGIIGLVVGYTIVGALIFQKIEGSLPPLQTHREQDAAVLLNLTAGLLWNATCCGVVPLEEAVWRQEVTRIVKEYQENLVQAYKSAGSGSAKSTNNWSFSGAFLYSLTVITTIGYGNVTPRSEWGKITTVLYAIIGMPLFLLYLSNIGDILAKSFKWTYAKLWLCKGCPGARRRRLARALQHQQQQQKYSVKAVTPAPPAVPDFGDNHSWTPGATAAALPGRRRLGAALGVHAPYDGYLEAGHVRHAPPPPAPGGRHRRLRGRGRSRGRREDGDEEVDWERPPPGRARRVGVDYGRDPDEEEDEEYDGEEWDDTSARSRSRSAFRADRQDAGAEPACGGRPGWRVAGGRPQGPPQRRGRRAAEDEDVSEDSEDDEEEEEEEESLSTEEDLDDEEEEEEELEEEESDHEDDDVDEGEVADEDTDGESSTASSESYDPQTVTVPVTLCLAIMVSYVCGGAMLFAQWESWNLLDGSYFCFISLSTIGFGDIVPGGTVYSEKVEMSFIFCSMYLMLGMALIAMCFNLMQEEVIHKMRSCVRTLRYVTRCNRRQAGAVS